MLKIVKLPAAAIAVAAIAAAAPAVAQTASTDQTQTQSGQMNMDGMKMGHAQGVTPDAELDANVMSTLQQCQQVAPTCAQTVGSAAGVLVFPSVLTVDLGVGGSGGKGALVQNGQITGYYNIGEASAGFQIGVKEASQVYVFQNESSLQDLMRDGPWELGAAADLTVISANVSASAQTGDPLVFVFDADGLNAGANVSVLKIWRDDDN
ncbi:MAG: YSC84-related protein [Tranquillimonas sp.]|jgi:lipid-binding SYLF domain-containing protein